VRKQSAVAGCDSQDVKEIRRDSATEDGLNIFFSARAKILESVCGEVVKDVCACAQVSCVGRRDESGVVTVVDAAILPNTNKSIQAVEVVRMQEKRTHHAKDRGIGAKAQCECQNANGGEARALSQRAESVAQVVRETLYNIDFPLVAAFFLVAFHSPEFPIGRLQSLLA
jgi:hypothetical protein